VTLWFPLFALWPVVAGVAALVLMALPIALLLALPLRRANAVWRFVCVVPHLAALFIALRGFQLEASFGGRTVRLELA